MLVIVDLQTKFPESQFILSQCLREFDRSVAKLETIVCLRYARRTYDEHNQPTSFWLSDGDILPELQQAIDLYPNAVVCNKFEFSGGTAIEEYLRLAAVSVPETFRVCGLYTHKCVFETVTELHTLFPGTKIEVVADATCVWNIPGAESCQGQYLNKLSMIDNVSVVDTPARVARRTRGLLRKLLKE